MVTPNLSRAGGGGVSKGGVKSRKPSRAARSGCDCFSALSRFPLTTIKGFEAEKRFFRKVLDHQIFQKNTIFYSVLGKSSRSGQQQKKRKNRGAPKKRSHAPTPVRSQGSLYGNLQVPFFLYVRHVHFDFCDKKTPG